MRKKKKRPLKTKKYPKVNLALKTDSLKLLINYKPEDSDATLINKLRNAYYNNFLNNELINLKEYFELIRSNVDDIPKHLKLLPKAVKEVKKKINQSGRVDVR